MWAGHAQYRPLRGATTGIAQLLFIGLLFSAFNGVKISGFVVSAGEYGVTLKARSASSSIPETAVFNKGYSNHTVYTHLITYEQTEHTMERQNKTTLRKEYKGELYWEV
jgi:sRNA-binding regulator protein Hfq